MSTRGCIAKLTSEVGEPITFRGVYHHWDSYEKGLGNTLFNLRNGHFGGNTKAMLKVLISEHKAGWSTINGKDFNLKPAPRPDDNTGICLTCGLPYWRHYAQDYTETNKLWLEAGKPVCPPKISGYCVTDHRPESAENLAPECYEDKPFVVTQKNASGSGCEYIYAFTKDGNTMVILSSYCADGRKMIGAFGCGDPNAQWTVIGEVDLNDPTAMDEYLKAKEEKDKVGVE